jgi:hypothetical protein
VHEYFTAAAGQQHGAREHAIRQRLSHEPVDFGHCVGGGPGHSESDLILIGLAGSFIQLQAL